ncbi:hypothetical protein KR018_004729, partial [Drosophila ironensis]
CPLTRPMIEGTNRIFTNRDAASNHELKRTQRVRTGEKLFMVCKDSDIVETTCTQHQNFSRPFPMRCTGPIAPTATIVTDASCSATMYSVGYTIKNRHLELYRACYDRTNVKALFTTHLVYHKTFFPTRTCTQFTRDGALSEADAGSFTPRSIYRSFRQIFGNTQQYVRNDRDIIINRGHLTPAGDYLYGDQMCATFKYINVIPQWQSINEGNWETIERWVRNRISAGGHLRIRTGVTGTLSLMDRGRPPRARRVILGANVKNPMPEWIYKVVRTATNQPHTVFMTLNNIYARSRPNPPSACTSVPCPNTVTLANTATAGYTFCCNATIFRI